VQLERTDVREIVREAVSSAEEALPANGHKFVLDLPDEPLAAEADREKLKQILANLLDNAVRYSPDGGAVTVAARQAPDAVELRVDDEGAGIPEAERRRIFAKFYRADADAAAGSSGTGLGLFIVQQLVEAMGGRVKVDSREPRGSSFVVELPLPSAVEPAERA
jgi:two-component system phosphate regulon sensor histidine kinase PhoR